ncbi:MAG: hypothetical protein ACTSVI_15395 [Promethearchaeota archaeon]
MYNIKILLEQRKKLLVYLLFILITLIALGVSLIPSMNYLTGENMSNNIKYFFPAFYISVYLIFIIIIVGILITLTLISRKLYIVRKIDESIKGIKKGKILEPNTSPRRDELLQSYYAEQIRATGMNTNKLKLFEPITDEEKHAIIDFKIDENIPDPNNNF